MANEKMTNGFSSFIVELSVNKTDEDRERSRARLQRQFDSCDSRLNGMLKDNRENISSTVEYCGRIIKAVSDSKDRCQALKNKITRCMAMLECNRDNIREMWLESLEHKYAHKILSEIEELRKIPGQVKESLVEKKLEHATEVIVASIKFLDGSLCNADALKDLRSELHGLQEKLYGMLLEDLRKNLYFGSFIPENFGDIVRGEVTYEDVFGVKMPKQDRSLKELLNKISLDKDYVSVLLNCLRTMKRLPDAMEFFKENFLRELSAVFMEISKLMYDVIEKSVDASPLDLPIEKQHVFLVDLVENTMSVLQKILDNYNEFFNISQKIVEMHNITELEFQIEDVYSKLQTSLEDFIGIYLDSRSLASPRDSIGFESSQNVGRISSFFSPQSFPDDKDSSLFKFSSSCHGIRLKKLSKDSSALGIDLESTEVKELAAKPPLVCRPTHRNITLIFNSLKSFVTAIEQNLNLNSADHGPLYSFLHDSANLFLDHVNSEINRMLQSISANLEAWNTTPVGDSSSRSGSEKEVLSCSLILNNAMKELQNLMNYLPDYSNHFLRLIYYVILDYKDMYHRAFKQMFEEEQNILSVSWARDRDIRRLMKSFLNWRHLEDEDTVMDIIESPEEICLRNKEESELLIRNLRSEEESSWEIITDSNKLTNLALLQENLIWFSVELIKFIKKFNQSQPNVQAAPSPVQAGSDGSIASSVTGLRKVIKEYEDFADMCLLALHLEVRARCFHYLLTFSSREVCVEGNFIQELDTAVKHLTSDLLQIDEVLLPILTPKEFKYVFEGVGELVASLMILIASNMNKINENVVLKIDRNIFIIQCCLANITMAREVSLERARQFIDLLKSTHEEILDQLVEEGPRFNEQEYASVFRIVSSSAAEPRRELEYYLEKLKSIFERLSAKTTELPKVVS